MSRTQTFSASHTRQNAVYRPFCLHLYPGNPFYAPAGLYILQELYPPQQRPPRHQLWLRVFSESAQLQAVLELKLDPVTLQAEILLSAEHVQGPHARHLRRAVAAALFQQSDAAWLSAFALRASSPQAVFLAPSHAGFARLDAQGPIHQLELSLHSSVGEQPYRLQIPDHLSLSEFQALLPHCPQLMPEVQVGDRWRFFRRGQSYVSHSQMHAYHEHIWSHERDADQIPLRDMFRRLGSRLDYAHHFGAPVTLRVTRRSLSQGLLQCRCYWPSGQRPAIEFKIAGRPQIIMRRTQHHVPLY